MPVFQQGYPGTVASLTSALPFVLNHISPAFAFFVGRFGLTITRYVRSLESQKKNVHFLQLCHIISLHY